MPCRTTMLCSSLSRDPQRRPRPQPGQEREPPGSRSTTRRCIPSIRARMHRERRRRGRHRIGARFHGHPGDFDDQLDRARCRAPLDLTSVPLPTRLRTPASRPGSTTYRLFDPRRHRYGAPDRRIHHEERDAADNRDRLTVSSASARRAEANSPESRTRNDGTAKRPVDSHTGIG